MSYIIEMEGPLLRLWLTGTLTNRDLEAVARDADRIEATFDVVPHRLTETRGVTQIEVDFDGIYELAQTRRTRRFPNAFKSAVIASDLTMYTLARMFQTLNQNPQITVALFPDEEPARAWLAEPGLERPAQEWVPPAQGMTG